MLHLQALSKALTELRADMIQQTQEAVKHHATEGEQEINIQRLIDKSTKEYEVCKLRSNFHQCQEII